ncbi:MAG: hypothetical protein A2144_07155 [Chloroflexi bacterium RBG_16_50_9]|nr:MAG: hypothetical protein A2144_07155 [Chloroflexi bacterium RBG_16_50_9]
MTLNAVIGYNKAARYGDSPSLRRRLSGKSMTNKNQLFYGYVIVIVSFLIMMIILGFHPSFGIFFKPIIEELGWTRTVTSGAFSLSIVMGGLAGIFMGRLNDKLGPRIVMTAFGLISGIGYLLMSQVQNAWQMYLFFGIIVGSGSGVFSPTLSTVARWFVRRRSMMTGIVVAGSGAGMLIMPLLINWLISTYHWRTTFLVLGFAILVVVVVTAQFLKRDPTRVGQAAYGENDSGEEVPNSDTRAFSFREAMHTRQLWLFSAVLFCFGFGFFSIQLHIAPYIIDQGISATIAAAIIATIGGATIIGEVGLGSTGDKIGYKRAFLIGAVLMALAFLVLILVKELWAFYLLAILSGLAFGNSATQESPIAAWLYGLKSHGQILGFFSFCYTVGGAIGPVTTGYIFDRTGNYQLGFLLSAGLAVIAIILASLLKPPIAKNKINNVSGIQALESSGDS